MNKSFRAITIAVGFLLWILGLSIGWAAPMLPKIAPIYALDYLPESELPAFECALYATTDAKEIPIINRTCGATAISENMLITAAHCLVPPGSTPASVVCGDGKMKQISFFEIDSNYMSNDFLSEEEWQQMIDSGTDPEMDVGYIYMAEPLEITPARIAKDQTEFAEIMKTPSACSVLGFGPTRDNAENTSLNGIKAPFKKFDGDGTPLHWAGYFLFTDSLRHGDSGGGLVCKNTAGEQILVGINSRVNKKILDKPPNMPIDSNGILSSLYSKNYEIWKRVAENKADNQREKACKTNSAKATEIKKGDWLTLPKTITIPAGKHHDIGAWVHNGTVEYYVDNAGTEHVLATKPEQMENVCQFYTRKEVTAPIQIQGALIVKELEVHTEAGIMSRDMLVEGHPQIDRVRCWKKCDITNSTLDEWVFTEATGGGKISAPILPAKKQNGSGEVTKAVSAK